MILAIDTLGDGCSVCLYADNRILGFLQTHEPRQQTQQILPLVDQLLTECKVNLNQLVGIGFNRGPGGFSGIRINTAVAQALSFAHDTPCIGVSSLQVLAQAAHEHSGATKIVSIIDARMQQVYLGTFALETESGLMQPTIVNEAAGSERLIDYAACLDTIAPVYTPAGDVDLLSSTNPQPVAMINVLADARVLAKLAWHNLQQTGGVSAAEALPVYLRHNAWKTLEQQRQYRQDKQAIPIKKPQ